MKKTILLLIICIVSICNSQAQNTFAPVGAEWNYTGDSRFFDEVQGWPDTSDSYLFHDKVKSEAEVMWEGKMCKKLNITRTKRLLNGTPLEGLNWTCYLYDNTDMVFVWMELKQRFDPLYIFNVQAGDTVHMSDAYTESDTLQFDYIVDSVTTEEYNNNSLKAVHFHKEQGRGTITKNSYSWGYGSYSQTNQDGSNSQMLFGKYVQKLGAFSGLFPNTVSPWMDASNYIGFPAGYLRCYSETGNEYLVNNGGCGLTPLSVKSIGGLHGVLSVEPNPAQNFVTISRNLITNETIEVNVIEMTGKVLKHYFISDKTESSRLDISTLKDGIYMLEVQVGNERLYHKMLVQH